MRKLILVLLLILCLAPVVSLADFTQIDCGDADPNTYCAATCSPTDLRAAIAAADTTQIGGAEITMPPGDCQDSWSVLVGSSDHAIEIEKTGTLIIRGSGNGDNPLVDTIIGTGVGVYDGRTRTFFITSSEGALDHFELSDMRIYSWYGCTSDCHNTAFCNLSRVGFWHFHDLHIEGYFHPVFQSKSLTNGLMNNNVIRNNNTAVLTDRYGISPGSPGSGYPSVICSLPSDGGGWQMAGLPSDDYSSSVAAGNTAIAGGTHGSYSAAASISWGGSPGTPDTGTVRRIYINVASVGASPTVRIASFSNTGNTFTARARSETLPVSLGLNVITVDDGDFTPFAIHNGDYVGAYLTDCTLEASTGSQSWTLSGDQTQASSIDFGTADMGMVALWVEIFDDTGNYATCEQQWVNWYNDETRSGGYYHGFRDTANGWTDPDWSGDDGTAIFIENNEITYYSNHIAANWGSCARLVVRHNDINTSPTYAGTSIWSKPGTQYLIVNNNLITNRGPSTNESAHWYTNSGLNYRNKFVNWNEAGHLEAYRHYSSYYFPLEQRPKEMFIFENDYGDMEMEVSGGNGRHLGWTINWCQGHGCWMGREGEDGMWKFRAPTTGDRLYSGDPANPVDEYECPHPLSGATGDCDGTQYGRAGYGDSGGPGGGTATGSNLGSGSATMGNFGNGSTTITFR